MSTTRCSGPATQGGAARRRAQPAPARVSRLLGGLHLTARGRSARGLAAAAAQDRRQALGVDEEYLATGIAREHPYPVELVEADVALRLDDLDTARDLYERALRRVRSPEQGGGTGRARPARPSSRRSCSGGRRDRGGTRDGAFAGVDVPGLIETLGKAYAAKGELESAIAVFERGAADAAEAGDSLGQDPLRDLARKRAHRQR